MLAARRAASPERDSIVALGEVSKTFEATGTTALERISLDVGQGAFVSLLGPSGCGKSTLLRIVADLVEPSSGTVTVAGHPPRQAREQRDYGMVFQAATLFNWRTIRRNVELPLEVMGWGKAERRARAEQMLGLVDLIDVADHRPPQLSGGMQQRVAIARALAFEPKLLLMDEPFGALDEITRERLQGELLDIRERTGTTVLFVTHSIPEAVFLSTSVVVMSPRPGRVLAEIGVDLPYPRTEDTRETERYFELVTEVREVLRGGGGT